MDNKITEDYFESLIKNDNIIEFKKIIKDSKISFLIPFYNKEFQHYYLNYALHRVIIFGKMDFFNAMYEDSRIDPAIDRNYSVYKAAEYGHIDILKILMSNKKIKINDRKGIALEEAARNQHFDTFKLLIDTRLFDNISNALIISLKNKNVKIAKYIFNYHKEVVSKNRIMNATNIHKLQLDIMKNNIFTSEVFFYILKSDNHEMIDFVMTDIVIQNILKHTFPEQHEQFALKLLNHKIDSF
jgi:hypothetical protein